MTAELLLSGREGGSIGAEVHADVVVGDAAGSTVDLAIQIDPRTLKPGSRRGALPIEVYTYALDPLGVVRDFFTLEVRLDPSVNVGDDGVWIWGKLRLPPGDYTVRTLLRATETGEIGVRTTRVTVPAG